MNTFLPEQIGTGGHTVGDNYKATNTNKQLTAKIRKMLIDGTMAPDTKAEVLMIREAKQKEADIERENSMSDIEADGNALASAGYGTDEDYGPTTEEL